MREILFRAKAVNRDGGWHRTSYKNGDWVYGLITRLYDERFETLPAEMRNVDGVNGIEIDYKTIGQYTGLTDKNGKKIFEGDIIRSLYMNCPKNEHIEKVTFFDGRFMAENATGNCYTKIAGENSPKHFIFDKSFYMIECEVIGNIHDNKELLKGGAE